MPKIITVEGISTDGFTSNIIAQVTEESILNNISYANPRIARSLGRDKHTRNLCIKATSEKTNKSLISMNMPFHVSSDIQTTLKDSFELEVTGVQAVTDEIFIGNGSITIYEAIYNGYELFIVIGDNVDIFNADTFDRVMGIECVRDFFDHK